MSRFATCPKVPHRFDAFYMTVIRDSSSPAWNRHLVIFCLVMSPVSGNFEVFLMYRNRWALSPCAINPPNMFHNKWTRGDFPVFPWWTIFPGRKKPSTVCMNKEAPSAWAQCRIRSHVTLSEQPSHVGVS